MNIRIKIMTALTAGVLILLMAAASQANAPNDYVPGQMVCQVLPGYNIEDVNSEYGTIMGSYIPEMGAYLLMAQAGQDADSLAAVISGNPWIVFCTPNYILDAPEAVQSSQPFLDENVIHDPHIQAAVTSLRLNETHTFSNGAGVKVAVIDAGVNLTHPMLSAVTTSGYDYVSEDSVANDEPGGRSSGHGTFVAGIINLVAPQAQIISYRVLDTTGRGDGYSVAEAVIRAVSAGCKVINLSLTMNQTHPVLEEAIQYAHDHDVMIIAAAGNDSLDIDKYPARDSFTLAVTAVDSVNVKADFANYGNQISVCAPGTHIYAPYLGSTYARWDGTSFSAPFVAGEAALLYSLNPYATWNDIRDAIENGSHSIDSLNPGVPGLLGSGIIDPLSTVRGFDPFVCGDMDGNGIGPDIADVVYFVEYVFSSGPAPVNLATADVNGDGETPDIADLVYLVDFSFARGPKPTCGL